MPRIWLLLCLLATAATTFGQPVGKTVRKRSTLLIEEYTVRTDDNTVRSGPYRKRVRSSGALLEEGQYAADARTGVWTFYSNGKPELVYNYTTHELLANNRPANDSLYTVVVGDTLVKLRLDRPPLLLASMQAVGLTLSSTSRFPIRLHQAGVSELTYQIGALVTPTTTKPGRAAYRVWVSVNDGEFEQNARQAAQQALDGTEWLPGMLNGQLMAAWSLLPPIVMRVSSQRSTR